MQSHAGVLRDAWNDGAKVKPADIEAYLDETAGTIDAYVRAHGFATPVVDPIAAKALQAVNADMALLYAIDATWPGSSARDDVKDLRTNVQARVDAYIKAFEAGNLAAILVLSAESTQEGGASNFWDAEGSSYSIWQEILGSYTVEARAELPEFRRGMRL